MLFLHIYDGDVEDPANAAMEEYLKVAMEVLVQGQTSSRIPREADSSGLHKMVSTCCMCRGVGASILP
jgi:hypothetical protein